MSADRENRLTIDVSVAHDGNYWVATCPALGLVAADTRQNQAWNRIQNMVVTQVVYALRLQPTLAGLFTPEYERLAESLRSLRQEAEFSLRLRAGFAVQHSHHSREAIADVPNVRELV